MVVIIKSPHSLQRVLNYNEQKCQKDHAECISAGNYLLQPVQLNFYDKLERMQELISRNERARKSNTLHISLNFDPSEKLSQDKLAKIAQVYMEKIGFGNQPYLVYVHFDAGHPHIHIVTTNIQADGKRIDTYNIGRNQSEKARKEIEKEFDLVKAQQKKPDQLYDLKPANVQKIQYGKAETRRSISNVVDHVINHFKYTSLVELNAVLKQYNVVADRGAENGVIYKYGGLRYHLLDSDGKKVGIPIKASSLHGKPTLKYLEKKFQENEVLRQPDKKKLKTAIDWVLVKAPGDLNELIKALKKENIQALSRENKAGQVYGITFIDYRTKSVFNGSNIGKQYSIAGLLKKLNENLPEPRLQSSSDIVLTPTQKQKSGELQPEITNTEMGAPGQDLLKDLMDSEKNMNRIPGELLKKKKKKLNKNL